MSSLAACAFSRAISAAATAACLAANARCQRQIGESGGLRPLIKCGYSRSTDLQQLVHPAFQWGPETHKA